MSEMNGRVHKCDCGFKWNGGQSGHHICGSYYRETIKSQEAEIEGLKASFDEDVKLEVKRANMQFKNDSAKAVNVIVSGKDAEIDRLKAVIVKMQIDLDGWNEDFGGL